MSDEEYEEQHPDGARRAKAARTALWLTIAWSNMLAAATQSVLVPGGTASYTITVAAQIIP